MKALLLVFISLLSSTLMAKPKSKDLSLHDYWVRAVPKVSKNSAAFITIKSYAKKDISLLSVSSTYADNVELHTSYKQGDKMMMRQVKKIDIPASKHIVLKPMGLHIMLLGLSKKFHKVKSIPINLKFSNGMSKTLDFQVRSPQEAHQADQDKHHHHH